MHGGTTPRGPTHANFKTGRYSEWLPSNLRGSYEKLLADPEILSLKDEIALLRANLAELTADIEAGGSPQAWRQVTDLWKRFMRAIEKGDTAAQTSLLYEIDDIIQGSPQNFNTWRELRGITESIRKLSDSESARLQKQNYLITVEQAMAIIALIIRSMAEIVKQHTDTKTATLILNKTDAESHRLLTRTIDASPSGNR